MKNAFLVMLSFSVWYGLLLLVWAARHRLAHRNVVEVPDADLLEPEDLAEQENVCRVTGEKHRWKSLGYDRKDNHWSECKDCGQTHEQ